MKEMDDVLEITSLLMGPNGCPWDAKQTFHTLQKHFLEEVHEVVEAIDENDPEHVLEELGDVFYIILFAAKIAEKDGLFTIRDVLMQQKEKLIRRHPHVFSKEEAGKHFSLEELEERWQKIKQEEKKNSPRTSRKLPSNIPLLLACQKAVQKLGKRKNDLAKKAIEGLETSFQKKFFTFLYQEVLSSDIDLVGEVRRGWKQLETFYEAEEKISSENS